jgi:hypothetical protein
MQEARRKAGSESSFPPMKAVPVWMSYTPISKIPYLHVEGGGTIMNSTIAVIVEIMVVVLPASPTMTPVIPPRRFVRKSISVQTNGADECTQRPAVPNRGS